MPIAPLEIRPRCIFLSLCFQTVGGGSSVFRLVLLQIDIESEMNEKCCEIKSLMYQLPAAVAAYHGGACACVSAV